MDDDVKYNGHQSALKFFSHALKEKQGFFIDSGNGELFFDYLLGGVKPASGLLNRLSAKKKVILSFEPFIKSSTAPNLTLQKPVRIQFFQDNVPHYFEALVIEKQVAAESVRFTVEMPEKIYRQQKRELFRLPARSDIDLGCCLGTIEAKLINVSGGGAAISLKSNQLDSLQVGAVIPQVTVKVDSFVCELPAEIRYIRKEEKSGDVIMGLSFLYEEQNLQNELINAIMKHQSQMLQRRRDR